MTVRDPNTGVPLLGGVDLRTEARKRTATERHAALIQEKQNLAPDDHDWGVIAGYGVSQADAEAIVLYKATGIEADPPIVLSNETMRGEPIGPVCNRCEQMYEFAADQPCPGMSFSEYLASLPEDLRNETIAKLQEKAEQMDKLADAIVDTIVTEAAEASDTESIVPLVHMPAPVTGPSENIDDHAPSTTDPDPTM